jgi:SAM-dependent methyltransferase
MEGADEVREGFLQCPASDCLAEYPILDGIPVILAEAREFIQRHHASFARREDLSPALDTMLLECAGPGSLDASNWQHLSGAMWDHYGDLDDELAAADFRPGAIVGLVEAAQERDGIGSGLAIDVGAGVGRSTFEIAARTGELVLGLDLHVASLRAAQRVMRTSRVSYDLRRAGVLYERRGFDVSLPGMKRTDFWLMDGAEMTIEAKVGTVAGFNVLDCVASPRALLQKMADALALDGRLTVCTPFDWSGAATPIEQWLGGHSPRGTHGGRCEEILVAMLRREHEAGVSGLRVLHDERALEWQVRLHSRAIMRYVVQMVTAARSAC